MRDHGHSKAEVAKRLAARQHQSYLRDTVYGAIDGTVTTFAIVAGVQGAGLSPSIVIALGIANVLADGFSMAASNYSGTKAELDERRRLRRTEENHIRKGPVGEREELRQILAAKGMSGHILEGAVDQIAANTENWIEIMLTDEYGLPPANPNPLGAALATFLAFLLTGIIPLTPYILRVDDAFGAAIAATAAVFFLIGAAKSRWSLSRWWVSGLETLAIGSIAAAIAYFVGTVFRA